LYYQTFFRLNIGELEATTSDGDKITLKNLTVEERLSQTVEDLAALAAKTSATAVGVSAPKENVKPIK
jgi:hypothetical protein